MAYEVGNWRVTKSIDAQGSEVDDSKVLMKRPDGQPCNVQAQYVPHYERKGFVVIDDPLVFDDIIAPSIKKVKPISKKEKRLKALHRKNLRGLKEILKNSNISYKDEETKDDIVLKVYKLTYATK